MDQINNDKSTNCLEAKCPIHQRFNLNAVHIQYQVENNLVCSKCIQERKISTDQIVFIQEILNETDDTIIPLLTPFEDGYINPFLLDLENQQEKIEAIIDSTNQYFDKFKQQIMDAIQQYQNQTKLKISTLLDLKQQIQDTYNQISLKQSLKQIFLENSKEIRSQINQVIDDSFENIQSNTQILKEKINNYKFSIENLNLIGKQNSKETFLNIAKKITELEQAEKGKIIDDKLDQKINQNYNKKTSGNILLDLIKNPTNYCTEKFINELEQYFNKYEYIFNQLQIQEDSYDQEKKSVFSDLSISELKDVSQMVKHTQTIKSMYQNNEEDQNVLSKQIQFNSQVILNLLTEKYHINSKKLEILLLKYPIFDSLSKFEINQIDKLNFSKQFNYLDSSQQNIIRTNNNHIEIELTKIVGHAISYINFNLDPKTKYIFRMKMSDVKQNYYAMIGLIKEPDLDKSSLINSDLAFTLQRDVQKTIIQGETQKQYNMIEMRIHLENQFVQVADYPNYENITQLKDKTKLVSSSKYRLATHLIDQSSKITIFCFATVENFDSYM